MYRIFYFFLAALIINSCSPTLQKTFVSQMPTFEERAVPRSFGSRTGCADRLNYVPSLDFLDHTPMKTIRVNVHYMQTSRGKGNFDRKEGIAFAKQIIRECNRNMRKSKKMNLPAGNNNAAMPALYKYVLTPDPKIPGDVGVYFHRDDDSYFTLSKGKNRNLTDKSPFEKYGVQKGKVLNIFMMAYHQDSVRSKTYGKQMRGIAFGDWVKLIGGYYHTRDTITRSNGKRGVPGRWNLTKNLNHEIGHCLGLAHTWSGNDGCDDTPNHGQCWKQTKSGRCKDGWSNNVMDYNVYMDSWSHCQVGTAHYNMSNKSKKIRNMLEPTWCKLKEDKTIEIRQDFVWQGAKDLEGHVVVMDGATLTITCRVSMPKKAKIVVYPKGKLVLDGATLENDCGDKWLGIETWKYGNNQGVVEFKNNPQILNVENPIASINNN